MPLGIAIRLAATAAPPEEPDLLGESVEMEGATGAAQTLYNPLFGGSPITSTQSGDWSSTSTWEGGVVPDSGDDVRIIHEVTVNTTGLSARHIVVEDVGTLAFADGSALSAWTVIVNGTTEERRGHLKMGTAASPISATLTVRDVAVDAVEDPWQFWGGVCVVNYGKWTAYGVTRNVRSLYFEASAGATTVDLYDLFTTLDRYDYTIGAETVSLYTLPADPADGDPATLTGWAVGDRLFFPGTLTLSFTGATTAASMGAEWRTITAIDGNTVTLNAALTYNHFGQDSDDGNIHYYPVVQNLTRSLKVMSEDPAGVRGHSLVSHRAYVDLRYLACEDMGRSVPTVEAVPDTAGSIRGRYPIHIHHCRGPAAGITGSDGAAADGYGYYLYGCSAYNTADPGHVTWLAAVHDASFGYLGYCDFNWYYGSGLITEEGVEVENVFEHNRAMFGTGDGGFVDTEGVDDFGFAGSAMWFRGPGNRVRFNVASNVYGAGPYQWGMNSYSYFLQTNEFTQVRFQTAVGQNRHDEGELRYANSQNFLQNEGNYLFSCTGLHTAWWIATMADGPYYDGVGGEVLDLMCWNSYGYSVFLYEHHQVTHRRNVVLHGGEVTAPGVLVNDYRLTECAFADSYIESGTSLPSYLGVADLTPNTLAYGTFSFTNCIFDKVATTTIHNNGGGQGAPGRETIFENCVFTHATSTIVMAEADETGRDDVRDIIVVIDYRRSFADAAGDSFRVQPDYRPALPNPLAGRSEIDGNLFEIP